MANISEMNSEKEKTSYVTVEMRPEIIEKYKELCELNGDSASGILKDAILAYIENHVSTDWLEKLVNEAPQQERVIRSMASQGDSEEKIRAWLAEL